MHTEHCTDLRDHDVPRGHPAMQSINEPSRPVRVVKMVNRDVNRTVASRCARQRVQTQLFKSAQRLRFSPDPLVGRISPSSTVSKGFTASTEPSIAAAVPIRPPRRRYSKLST